MKTSRALRGRAEGPFRAPQICPMCGAAVGAGAEACESCPISSGCEVLCCPRCGYRFVERSVIWEFFRSLASRFSGRRASGRTGGKEVS